MINELEGPIARRHPEIEHMKSALRRVGALAAAMSGSGSTVFGLFQRKTDALAAVTGLQGAGWHVVLTESLGRVEYARAALPRRLVIRPPSRSSLMIWARYFGGTASNRDRLSTWASFPAACSRAIWAITRQA